MKQRVKIDFSLEARIQHDPAAGVYVTWCPQLDVYSQGETEDVAKRALINALKSFLTTCYHRKVLDDFLLDHGFDIGEDPAAGSSRMTSEAGEITVVDPPAFRTYPVDFPLFLELGHRRPARASVAAAEKCPS